MIGTGSESGPARLRDAVLRRVLSRDVFGGGSLALPAVPALVDVYVDMLADRLFPPRPLSGEERADLRSQLQSQIESCWRESPESFVRVRWEKGWRKAGSISLSVEAERVTFADTYETWTRDRRPPLFGAQADAKVLEVAASFGAPDATPCLDVGAGTGRNALPLAQLGYPVTAVDASPALVELLRVAVAEQAAAVEIFAGDILDSGLVLPGGPYRVAFLSEVLYHFRSLGQVERLFARMADLLAPGGILLFNAFLADDGYEPDELTRQYAEWVWTTFHTRAELAAAVAPHPFELESTESVEEYERAHLPADAWPPVHWYAEWVRGEELFDLPVGEAPVRMYWIAYRRTA